MRIAIHIVFACGFLLAAASSLPALSRADFDAVVDFSVNLKTLAAVANGEAALPSGKLFVVDGTVSDVHFLDKEQATFRVRIEIISGEWIGVEEDVKSYACYVEFSGEKFFRVFPSRAPRTVTPDLIVMNSRVLVVARPIDVIPTPQGEKRVRLEGLYVRSIK